MTRNPTRAATVLGALAALALLPAAASGTTTVSYSAPTGMLIQGDNASEGLNLFDGSAPNTVLVEPGANQPGISPATLVAGSGCQQQAVTDVVCQLTGSRIVTAKLGGGADQMEQGSSGTFAFDEFIEGQGGNDILRSGGLGADLVDGGAGDDVISTDRNAGGNDRLEGGDGNDRLNGDQGGTTTIHGGNGNDTLLSRGPPSPDLFDGGPGVDTADYSGRREAVTLRASLQSTPTPDDGAPGEGDDLDNVEVLVGGSGSDTLEFRNTSGATNRTELRTLRGNGGADTLRVVGAIFTFLDGGLGMDVVSGGSAPDTIFSREGEKDTITCGGGLDTLTPDLRDEPISADCENLNQGDRREGPNVTIRNRTVAVGADGLMTVRLACPRSVAIGCRGVLSVRLDRSGTHFGTGEHYTIRHGRRSEITVKLAAGQLAGARRSGARVRVRSVERGVHGPKTTQRSLPSRRG